MKVKLTDMTIRALPFPGSGQVDYYDTVLPAFGVRASKLNKTFFLITGTRGKRVRHVLGKYPATGLSEARDLARRLQSHIKSPPNSPLHSTKKPTLSPTFTEALQSYLNADGRKMSPTYFKEVSRIFQNNFQPSLGQKPLITLELEDIASIIDDISKDKPGQANSVHAKIKTFFTWAKRRSLIKQNPVEGLSPPSKTQIRDRVLSDDELRAVYLAAQTMGHPFGFICLIAIHTGLRRANIARLQWEWISADYFTFPAEEMKRSQPFILPNLINDNLRLIPKTSPHLFPSDAGTPFSAFSKSKKKLDTLHDVKNYTLHDLRRTFRTNLSKWQCCTPEVAERLIAHTVGSQVQRTYDLWSYIPEMQSALEKYERHLGHLIGS